MNVLDLFSGIGGFSLGLERAGMHTVAFCEQDEYCRAVLRKHWPDVPCWTDIRGIDADGLGRLGRVDLVCGGFPCQPFSVAGEQKGKDDHRHLWPEMRRVIALARPTWVIGENVAGLIAMALDDVLFDLESLGYTARTFVIPACAVGAPHRRDRLWIVAHAGSERRQQISSGSHGDESKDEGRPTTEAHQPPGDSKDAPNTTSLQRGAIERNESDGALRSTEDVAHADGVARNKGGSGDGAEEQRRRNADRSGERTDVCDTNGAGLEIREGESRNDGSELPAAIGTGWWEFEPDVGRVAHGVPRRVDRLRCLGNAVVPQVVEEIGRAIMSNAFKPSGQQP